MPRFAANLSTMYGEHAFLDRYAAARADGFDAVEAQAVHTHAPASLREQLDRHHLQQVLFNAPAGDPQRGERGYAAVPGRRDDFRRSIATALEYAAALQCTRIHVMSGLVDVETQRGRYRETLVENLAWAAPLAVDAGVTLLIEPINPRDVPGYFLNHQAEAHAICADVMRLSGAGSVKVQMDFYHCQIVEGDLAKRLRAHIAGVGHIQIAGVPERHEPDTGEINYPYLFALMDELGYRGWVGCEYTPRGATSAGLGWLVPHK